MLAAGYRNMPSAANIALRWVQAMARRRGIFWLYYWICLEVCAVTNMSQKRALKNYRKRLSKRGMARFEVLGLDADRELIRSLAKRLAENDSDATRIRATVRPTIADEPPKKGGIVAALRP